MKYCVMYNNKSIYDAPSYEDAETVLEGIIHGNRWASSGVKERLCIEAHDGNPNPTPLADLMLWWDCQIGAHYSGWDAIPMTLGNQPRQEQVIEKERNDKKVYVQAQTALDAITKANLLLLL